MLNLYLTDIKLIGARKNYIQNMSQPEFEHRQELTLPQQIDPGIGYAQGIGAIEESKLPSTRKLGLGRMFIISGIAGVTGLFAGVATEAVERDVPEANADQWCPDPSLINGYIDVNQNGRPDVGIDLINCYTPPQPTPTNPPNQPTPTNPPTGGSTGNTSGGNKTPVVIPDTDGDGLKDNVDNCDNAPNTDQANFDSDIDGDVCDGDIDNDLVPNESDVNNNSSDNDADGLFDGYDPDSTNPDIDGDTVLDGDPTELEDKANDGTQDLFQSRIDTDGDGLSAETGDSDETDACIPSTEAAKCDQDEDGLSNEEEVKLGTDPKVADTDGDGVNDKKDKEPLSKIGAEVDRYGVTVDSTIPTTIEKASETESTTETTEAEVIAVNPENDDDGSSSLLLPIGGGLGVSAAVIAGLALFGIKRKRQSPTDPDPEAEFGETSPVAGN